MGLTALDLAGDAIGEQLYKRESIERQNIYRWTPDSEEFLS